MLFDALHHQLSGLSDLNDYPVPSTRAASNKYIEVGNFYLVSSDDGQHQR